MLGSLLDHNIAVKAQMKLRVRTYSWRCRGMVPRKKRFLYRLWRVLGDSFIHFCKQISL